MKKRRKAKKDASRPRKHDFKSIVCDLKPVPGFDWTNWDAIRAIICEGRGE